MKIQVIYSSINGKTKQIAAHFENCENILKNPNIDCNVLIVICPTYGDEELPLEMEDYLLNLKIKKMKFFVICETGNYYGYDDFTFGAGIILKNYFKNLGFEEFHPMLSLDSIPKIDWDIFFKWKKELYEKIHIKSISK